MLAFFILLFVPLQGSTIRVQAPNEVTQPTVKVVTFAPGTIKVVPFVDNTVLHVTN